MLRDEQIYLAHKAANPKEYPPGDAFFDGSKHDCNRDQIKRWKPTDVQLQAWDDLCHVAPTLSFTRPAKYMYRSIAQFGAWALARAQKTSIEILDDDDVSVISESASDNGAENSEKVRLYESQELWPFYMLTLYRKRSQPQLHGSKLAELATPNHLSKIT
jgi:hypothetical protein